MRVIGNNGRSIMDVPVSSWPNPTHKAPGIAEISVNARYSATGHKRGTMPGVRLRDGDRIPTLGPNPAQKGKMFADGINLHCGYSPTSRGSENCITIDPDYCEQVWNVLEENERGTVTLYRSTPAPNNNAIIQDLIDNLF